MTHHTPGPWQTHHAEYSPDTIVGNIDGPIDGWIRGTTVCTVENNDSFFANVNLICAAPELLGIVQELASSPCDLTKYWCINHSQKNCIHERSREILKKFGLLNSSLNTETAPFAVGQKVFADFSGSPLQNPECVLNGIVNKQEYVVEFIVSGRSDTGWIMSVEGINGRFSTSWFRAKETT